MALHNDGYVVKKLDSDKVTLDDAMKMVDDLNKTGVYNGMPGSYEFSNGREIKFHPGKGVKRRDIEPDLVGPFA
jgi:hypothetical protein